MGGMGFQDSGPDRNEFNAGETFYEIAHLHDEMHLNQSRSEAEHILEGLFHQMHERAVGAFLPGRC